MSVFRKNLITNDWVIFAPNRSKRPVELKGHESDNIKILSERPDYKDTCPFCRGNENPEDKEILRLPSKGQWLVRILENKYSSVDRNCQPVKNTDGLRKEIQGFGIHDVIIDNPKHNTTLALMSNEDLQTLLSAYLIRYQSLQKNDLVRHVVLFKNQGIKAGGSLEHPHSQIYGLPVIPFETSIRLREVERYYEINDRCLLCNIIEDESNQKERIIYENEHFFCFIPYAALSPFHFWVVPKIHSPSFSSISKNEIQSMADCIKVVFGKLFKHLLNPDFNFILQSLSHFDREQNYFHWYLSVIPHVKQKGGLEYAGGVYVNPVMPENAAEELRNIKV